MARCLGEAHGVGELFGRERPALGDLDAPAGDELERLRKRGTKPVLGVVANQRYNQNPRARLVP